MPSIFCYFLTIFLALLYATLLVIVPRWTLVPANNVGDICGQWLRETAYLHAALILGMVVTAAVLFVFQDNLWTRVATCLGCMVTITISLCVDIKRRSIPGIILDVCILLAVTSSLGLRLVQL